MIKILLVFGTRPEAIKMCPLIKEMRKHSNINCKVCLTAQHRDMLDQVMEKFNIHADYDLDIMKVGQTLSDITVGVLQGIDKILDTEAFDLVLVHGDTSTSFVASLAAFYHQIPIGHVEAGLRTGNLESPFPEEFNRQAVDLISNIYFAPTEQAKSNLLAEGKSESNIVVTGNTVIDALAETVDSDFSDVNIEWVGESRLILVTAHRRENQGEPMREMFCAIKRISKEYRDIKFIFPVHKNPKVQELAKEILGNMDNIRLVEPLDPVTFHNYMNKSYLILTDSGGIQEEAPALGKPVLVMRDTTERPEGIKAGTLKLVGCSKEIIYRETKELIENEESYKKMSMAHNPYGDGHASERIIDYILNKFKQ